jgi:hypothetical protein
MFNFVKFVAAIKGMATNVFSPLSFDALFGSGIRNPVWVKIGIRDRHPGSTTLYFNPILTATLLSKEILSAALQCTVTFFKI